MECVLQRSPAHGQRGPLIQPTLTLLWLSAHARPALPLPEVRSGRGERAGNVARHRLRMRRSPAWQRHGPLQPERRPLRCRRRKGSAPVVSSSARRPLLRRPRAPYPALRPGVRVRRCVAAVARSARPASPAARRPQDPASLHGYRPIWRRRTRPPSPATRASITLSSVSARRAIACKYDRRGHRAASAHCIRRFFEPDSQRSWLSLLPRRL